MPVPWPWAYLLLLGSGLSASPALSAVGLWIPNCGSGACEIRKFDCGVLRVNLTVESSTFVDRLQVRLLGPAEDRAEVVVVRVAQRRRSVLLAIVVVDDGVGVEVGAVVELDALAQLERVGQAVGADVGQLLGQDRDDLAQGAGLDAEQAFDDVQLDVRRVAVADEARVRKDHVAGQTDDERAAVLDRRRRRNGRRAWTPAQCSAAPRSARCSVTATWPSPGRPRTGSPRRRPLLRFGSVSCASLSS